MARCGGPCGQVWGSMWPGMGVLVAGPALGFGFLSPYLEKDVILLCGHLVDMVLFLTTFTLPSIKPILVLGSCLDDKGLCSQVRL